MLSTMQTGQLGVPLLLRHVQAVVGRSRVFTPYNEDGTTYARIAERAGRLKNGLGKLGVAEGAVVGTLCGATEAHLETYLGVPGSGRVLHTINVRLHDEQIEYVINGADDEAIVVDAAYVDVIRRLLPKTPRIKYVVVVGKTEMSLPEDRNCTFIDYEELLSSVPSSGDWPDVDENSAAIVCYTGGTTGMPKGVAYSHRSLWLQAASLCMANSLAINSSTTVLPAVPMYHVNGWGIPYAALMAGADLILPSKSLQPKDILSLIDRHKPDLAAGVPTIWTAVLDELKACGRRDLGSVKTISCGGAPVASFLILAYAGLGVEMTQSWGMTETSSMSAIGRMPRWATGSDDRTYYRSVQGRVACGLEVRVVESSGKTVPNDGKSVGEIQIRGPWVTASYLGNPDRAAFDGGWLRTGDLGTIDADGHVLVSDRAKDAIKSGGEWIPSLALEERIRAYPQIDDVAVVAVPDRRWQERPAAIVILRSGEDLDRDAISDWLKNYVPRWWIPRSWVLTTELPRTSVGKIDKKLLREKIASGALPLVGDPIDISRAEDEPLSGPMATC